MPHPTRIDRSRGCMLGLAVGDALGAPLEGLAAQQIRSVYGQVVDYVDGVDAWRKKPIRWRLPGLYSDDTQLALVLAECLLQHGRVDVDWLARTFVTLANSRNTQDGAYRGMSRSFRGVLEELHRGTTPKNSAQNSAGIGAAMRIAPLGLFYDNPDQLREAVLESSLLTHRDIRSLAGAMAVAFAVWRIARGESREPSLLFKLAHDVAASVHWIVRTHADSILSLRNHQHAVSTAIAHVESLLELPRDRAYAALVEEANRHGPQPDCRRPTMGFPPACIPSCLYLFFTTDSPEEALVEVINLGGDTDTAGAILGALVGAHWGDAALPTRWLRGLRNRDGVAFRAEALAQPAPRDLGHIPALVETERRLTDLESSYREDLMAARASEDDLGANRRR